MIAARQASPPLWLYPNLLGLDAPAVAVAWQWLFAKSFGVGFPPVFHLILGLSVWCIYLGDRIYDVLFAEHPENGTNRMRFTKRHRRPLVSVLIIASLVNLVLIVQHVPLRLIISGLATASLLAIYYALRFKYAPRLKSIIPREILCGMLFALGCTITPHAFGAGLENPLIFWLAVVTFGVTCSAEIILISIWEYDVDIAVNDSSIATEHSKTGTYISIILPVLILLCMLAAITLGHWQIYISVAVSILALFIMLRLQKFFTVPSLRVLADAVLLTPLIFIWF